MDTPKVYVKYPITYQPVTLFPLEMTIAVSIRCTRSIRKYSCANSPSAQTGTRIYQQRASHNEILILRHIIVGRG